MPKKPAIIIQNVAPGPPMATAKATPAMFPSPTVALSAVVSAPKGDICPTSSAVLYLPLIILNECLNILTFINFVKNVR